MADEASKQTLPDRLPLVVGVTGHRDLRDDDISKLEQAVDRIFDRLKRDYMHGDSETPLIVLSSLAEGADRLVARVAMKHGAKLIAPLPMPADEYRRDFEHNPPTNSLAEFNHLLAHAVEAPVMPYAKDNSLEAIQKHQEKRDLQYRQVGIFIVRHCHVLIALWNQDDENPAAGGTAEVVNFKRHGIPLDVTESARASLDAPEIGPVIYVDTPRAKPGGSITTVAVRPWGRQFIKQHRGGALRRTWRHVRPIIGRLFSAKASAHDEPVELRTWRTFAVQTAMTRQFNREAADLVHQTDSTLRLETSLHYLFEEPNDKSSGQLARAHAMKAVRRWCTSYAIADTLALGWQRRFKRDWIALFSLGFVAIAAFEVVTHVSQDLSLLFIGYALAFVGAFVYFIYARRRQHQERYLDYRALAEALRVAVFWKLLGIGSTGSSQSPSRSSGVELSSGESVADAYPIRQPRELDWIKTCLRSLELLDKQSEDGDLQDRFGLSGYFAARNSWVHGQLEFFASRGPKHERRARVHLICSFLAVLASAVFAVLLGLSDYSVFGPKWHWKHEELAHRLDILLIGVLPAIAAVFAGYAERLALEAQARQYDRMRALFERAHDLLPEKVEPENFRQMQALFAELGAEAMKENAAWVEIYRQRPIRPPQG